MKRKKEPLNDMPMTSMIDIIFQLMIFFIVTMSVAPAVKSAPQVAGNLSLPTPKQGDSEVSMVIQFQKSATGGGYDYYVLQGNDNSAEFYQAVAKAPAIVDAPALLRNIGIQYQVYYDENGLKSLLMEVRDSDPSVMIRAPESTPYGDVVQITGYMHSNGISKIAWVDGSLKDLKAEIKKTTARKVAES